MAWATACGRRHVPPPVGPPGGRIVQVVRQLARRCRPAAGQLGRARHKRPHACGNEHRTRVQLGALLGAHLPAACSQGLQRVHVLAQVLHRGERRHLLLQALRQLVRAAHGQGGDVVNRLVAIQLHALAAGVGQGVDEVGAQALQAQLEIPGTGQSAQRRSPRHRWRWAWVARRWVVRWAQKKRSHRKGAAPLGWQLQRCRSLILPGWPFHSSASASAALRLVMGFQPLAWSARR